MALFSSTIALNSGIINTSSDGDLRRETIRRFDPGTFRAGRVKHFHQNRFVGCEACAAFAAWDIFVGGEDGGISKRQFAWEWDKLAYRM
jgi:hypothetical protein